MMKRLLIVLLGLFITTLVFAETNETTKPTTDPSVHTFKLPNGLQLIVKEDHRAPVLIMQIWYRVGSSNEPPGLTGISHVVEHMMFQGTDKYPKGVFSRMIDENGGKLNAMTAPDFTMYYEKLANDKLALSFKLEADRMHNLSFNQEFFDKEKQVVINERKMRTDNDPQALTVERFNAAAYLGNPYHHPVVGWIADLKNMTLDNVKHWYKTWYAPNNAIIVVVGDVDPQKVYELANQYFGPLKPHSLPPVKPHPIVKPLGQRDVLVNLPAKLPFLIMGYNVPSATSQPDSWEPYALEVLSAILSGDDSARIDKSLIRGNEIATTVSVSYSLYSRLPNTFVIGGIPSQGHSVEQLIKALIKQIKAIQTTPITEKELSRVKTRLIAAKTYSRDSITTQASIIGSLTAVGLPWEEMNNYYEQIQKVTPEQIQAVAKKYLTPERVIFARLKPKSTQPQKTQVGD